MTMTNGAARMIAEWPNGTRFRINNILYTKIGATGMINEFTVMTFRDGKEKEVKLTVYPSNAVSLVELRGKA